jgi:hypothetical protein
MALTRPGVAADAPPKLAVGPGLKDDGKGCLIVDVAGGRSGEYPAGVEMTKCNGLLRNAKGELWVPDTDMDITWLEDHGLTPEVNGHTTWPMYPAKLKPITITNDDPCKRTCTAEVCFQLFAQIELNQHDWAAIQFMWFWDAPPDPATAWGHNIAHMWSADSTPVCAGTAFPTASVILKPGESRTVYPHLAAQHANNSGAGLNRSLYTKVVRYFDDSITVVGSPAATTLSGSGTSQTPAYPVVGDEVRAMYVPKGA